MTRLIHKNISNKFKILFGNIHKFQIKNFLVFDCIIVDFLDLISKKILNNKKYRNFPDIIAFAFWIRKKNILAQKEKLMLCNNFGKGLAFHITPKNMAINFMYSFALGLLSGNSNVVRVPSKDFNEISEILKILNSINSKKFEKIKNSNILIKYGHDEVVNNFFSNIADLRIIWGGDMTISSIKKINSKINCLDITFPDKYSVSILNCKNIEILNKEKYQKLIYDFYSDIYPYDQLACSSPHLIFWLNFNKRVVKKFWSDLRALVIKKYNLTYDISFNKFTKAQSLKIDTKNISEINFDSFVTIAKIKNNKNKAYDSFKGGYGLFYETKGENNFQFIKKFTKKIQTITYFGLNNKEIEKNVLKYLPLGIDRIVPIGKANEMSFIWDGYNLIETFSRKIDIK